MTKESLQKLLDLSFLDKLATTLINWASAHGLKVIVTYETDDPDSIEFNASDPTDEEFFETSGDALFSMLDDFVDPGDAPPSDDVSWDAHMPDDDMDYITQLIIDNGAVAKYN